MMPSTCRSFAISAGLVSILARAAGAAPAESPDERAARLEQSGQLDPASQAYAQAYARSRSARLLYDMARMHLRCGGGHEREALVLLERFQKEAPAGSLRTEVAGHLAALRRKLPPGQRVRAGELVKGYIELGGSAFAGGQYDLAGQTFALAYALQPAPLLLFNLAQVYRKAGSPEEALALYERFLHEEPQSPLRAEVEGYIAALHKDEREQREARAAAERAIAPAETRRAAVAAVPVAVPPPARAFPAPERRRPLQVAKWVVGALGLLAVAGGATLWALDGHQSCPTQDQHPCPLELDSKAAGIALVAGGGALLGASGVMFGVDYRRSQGGARTALLSLSGAF
jgi:tetratricopeptide (TPR) repeat protein